MLEFLSSSKAAHENERLSHLQWKQTAIFQTFYAFCGQNQKTHRKQNIAPVATSLQRDSKKVVWNYNEEKKSNLE